MKALSIRQPYASLILSGIKKIEVRTWPTKHRGELLVCSSARPRNFFWRTRERAPTLSHAGCMVGIVSLLDCRPMRPDDADAAVTDFVEGAYAWLVQPVCEVRPEPIKGKLSFYDVPDDKIVRLRSGDSIHNYPPPQGQVAYTDRCPTLNL